MGEGARVGIDHGSERGGGRGLGENNTVGKKWLSHNTVPCQLWLQIL